MKYIPYIAIGIFIVILAIHQQRATQSLGLLPQPIDVKMAPSSSSNNEGGLLNFPSNISSEQGKKWSDSVMRMEQTADIININNCKPSPLTLKIKKGAEFKVRNNSDVEITLYSHGSEYKISSGSIISIKAEFNQYATGFFGYRCRIDNEPKAPVIGILHIVE